MTKLAYSLSFPGGFTVLMAVYGRDDPALFERAVDSVFANTLLPDDFVLVVDGPTPAPLTECINRIASRYPLTVQQLEANVGLASALNHGLSHVRTAWIARADADDYNLWYRFERQAQALRSAADCVDLMGGAIVEVERDGVAIACREVPCSHEAIARRLQTRNPFNHMTVAYRTDCVRDAGGYPGIHLKEDWALWATMIARGARCLNVADVLVRATAGRDMYRRRGGLRYARSEWELQRHLLSQGRKSRLRAVLHGGMRAAVALIPSVARGLVYEMFLRRAPTVSESATSAEPSRDARDRSAA